MFRDRTEAGKQLATQLTAYANRADTIVLGLPRGGVPVAYEVAHALNLPLDVCLVRKLGVPGQREYAMGAIAEKGVRVLNAGVISSLNISTQAVDQVIAEEEQELQRRQQAYRGDRPPLNLKNHTVIVIDDGLATGSTMMAAIALLKLQRPQSIIVAVPVAPLAVCQRLCQAVNQVVCLATPEPFYAIALWYESFTQTTDQQVRDLLAKQP